MAITTSSLYGGVSFTEAVGEFVMEESRPRGVVKKLVNIYSIAGLKTGQLDLNRWDDIGQASSATEGTPFTATSTAGDTTVSATPTEGAVEMLLVTNDAIERRSGFVSVAELFNRGTIEAQLAALSAELGMANRAVDEKIENDLVALFASLSNTVGSSGSDLTLAQFDAGLLKLESLEDLPHDDIVASLDKEQWGNLRAALMVTSGGVAGTLWAGKDAAVHTIDVAMNGYKATLLGVPIFTHGVGVRKTANAAADVVGAMFLRGIGNPEQSGQGQPGCFALVEGRPKVITVEGDHRERGAELQVNAKYAAIERNDNFGVGIITDAP